MMVTWYFKNLVWFLKSLYTCKNYHLFVECMKDHYLKINFWIKLWRFRFLHLVYYWSTYILAHMVLSTESPVKLFLIETPSYDDLEKLLYNSKSIKYFEESQTWSGFFNNLGYDLKELTEDYNEIILIGILLSVWNLSFLRTSKINKILFYYYIFALLVSMSAFYLQSVKKRSFFIVNIQQWYLCHLMTIISDG